MNLIEKIIILSAFVLFSGCLGNPPPEKNDEGPVSFFTGKTGGIKLSDWGSDESSNGQLPVNALLWRAALDISSFVPLDDVDWMQPKHLPLEAKKVLAERIQKQNYKFGVSLIYALEQHGNKNTFIEQDFVMNKLRNENWTALNPELLELLNLDKYV